MCSLLKEIVSGCVFFLALFSISEVKGFVVTVEIKGEPGWASDVTTSLECGVEDLSRIYRLGDLSGFFVVWRIDKKVNKSDGKRR
jgi:hypothetical protein